MLKRLIHVLIVSIILFILPKYVSAAPYPIYSASNLTGKYTEASSKPSSIFCYYASGNVSVPCQISSSAPGGTTFQNSSIYFSNATIKNVVAIANPLVNEPFYKISMELSDTGQTTLQAWMTLIDVLWADPAVASDYKRKAVTFGIEPTQPDTYNLVNTDFLNPPAGSAEDTFNKAAKNQFFKRFKGSTPVKVEFYVTPKGTYVTVNGTNYGTVPDLYGLSYLQKTPAKYNFLAIGKWNTSGESFSVNNITFTKLPNNMTSTQEINSYWIKHWVDSKGFDDFFNTPANYSGDKYKTALQMALGLRMYDYYFGNGATPKKSGVQKLVDAYLDEYEKRADPTNVNSWEYYYNCYTNKNCPPPNPTYPNEPQKYDGEIHIWLNGKTVNPGGQDSLFFYIVSDYLTDTELKRFEKASEPYINVVYDKILVPPYFPITGYLADTKAEEIGWALTFVSGFYFLYPNATFAPKIKDMMAYTAFHTLNEGKAFSEVYPSYVFNTAKYNTSQYLNHKVKTIYYGDISGTSDDYKLDNHGHHPSVNYTEGVISSMAIPRNLLTKTSSTDVFGSAGSVFDRNVYNVFYKSYWGYFNYNTLRQNRVQEYPYLPDITVVTPSNYTTYLKEGVDDKYNYSPDAHGIYTQNQWTKSYPSGVEDWGNIHTGYNATDEFDNRISLTQALTQYYLMYNQIEVYNCAGAGGNNCSLPVGKFANFLQATYSQAFATNSNFNPKAIYDYDKNGSSGNNVLIDKNDANAYILKLVKGQTSVANDDINNDGNVSLLDVLRILKSSK